MSVFVTSSRYRQTIRVRVKVRVRVRVRVAVLDKAIGIIQTCSDRAMQIE